MTNDSENINLIALAINEIAQHIKSIEAKVHQIEQRTGQFGNQKILEYPEARLYALGVLQHLMPKTVVGRDMIRKGRPHDGGYVMLNDFENSHIAYSVGIGYDVSWDLDMAAYGMDIYQYDHTVDAPPEANPHFRFFKTGIAGVTDPKGSFKSLGDMIRDNKHENRTDMILKMDVEGAEWEAFEHMGDDVLPHFSQIVLELHRFINADIPGHSEKILAGLAKLNHFHCPVHVHVNNYGNTAMLGGVFINDTLEVTYVRKSDHTFTDCTKIFPTELDTPTNPAAPDIYLGRLG